MQDYRDHISKLFKYRYLFEKEVLNVLHDEDRAEIVHLLSIRLVHDILKEHINFLHMENLSDFTLAPVVNLLFKEIAEEWIDYAIEELGYTKDEALELIQDKDKVLFLKSLSKDYYKHFNEYIFTEIADTFIKLLESNIGIDSKSVFINAVINSRLIPNRSILNINSSDQLCKAAQSAQELKKEKLSVLEEKLKSIKKDMQDKSIAKAKREDLALVYPSLEKKCKELSEMKLEEFNETLKVVKRTIVNALKKMD